MEEIKLTPREVFDEYERGQAFKNAIGEHGLAEQAKINERFYAGDQWYGVQAGNSRPLVRRNFIKRIGEFKVAAVTASPVTVTFSAEGIAETEKDEKNERYGRLLEGTEAGGPVDDAEAGAVTEMLSSFFQTTAERVRLSEKCTQMLKNAYVSGTGFLHVYWDPQIKTGLYAFPDQSVPVRGDVECEVLEMERVVLGNPHEADVQKQPWILFAQRLPLAEVIKQAKATGERNAEIRPDTTEDEDGSKRVTVLTKMWKTFDEDGNTKVSALRVSRDAVVRKTWELGLRSYPLASFLWEKRSDSAWGDSEITYLIPNQIAVNRALTAEVWAIMNAGMPKLLVDRDSVSENLSNDPGQVVEINAGGTGVLQSVAYLQPPAFTAPFEALVSGLVNSTLLDAGASEAALGNVRPDNTSAIIQVREAAMQPMQLYQNRYYAFVEAVARIFAEFWLCRYGTRRIRVRREGRTEYPLLVPGRYRELCLCARVDVGASTVWSEAIVVSTLDNLLSAGLLTPRQYLERLPAGMIPDRTGLLRELAQKEEHENWLQAMAEEYPEEYKAFGALSPDEQARLTEEESL